MHDRDLKILIYFLCNFILSEGIVHFILTLEILIFKLSPNSKPSYKGIVGIDW